MAVQPLEGPQPLDSTTGSPWTGVCLDCLERWLAEVDVDEAEVARGAADIEASTMDEQEWLVWQARELGGRPDAGPADGVAFQAGLEGMRLRVWLEVAHEKISADASWEHVVATLLLLWFGSSSQSRPFGESPLELLKQASDEELEFLWSELERLAVFGAGKRPQEAPPVTPVEVVRLALVGIRQCRPWASWDGRKPLAAGGIRGHPRGQRQPKRDGKRQPTQALTDKQRATILKLRRERGWGERTLAREAGTTRHQVQRTLAEHGL